MPWQDQTPPAQDVVLAFNVPERPFMRAATFEIDRLEDGAYRVTAGTLFGSEELGRGEDLEAVLRGVNSLAWAATKAQAQAARQALAEMAPAPSGPRI